MSKYLVFYKVDNSCGYERHTFDEFDCQKDGKKVWEMITKLDPDEYWYYDLDHYGYGAEPSPNLADFQTDYNDEVLDGGKWVVYIELPD